MTHTAFNMSHFLIRDSAGCDQHTTSMDAPKILLFLLLIASFSLGARLETLRPPSWCKSQFKWNYDQKGVKLLDHCDILKDQFTLNIGIITDKTECINRIYLNIGGTNMKTWTGNASDEVTFENKLAVRKRQVWVTLTARNNKRPDIYFRSEFRLDSRNCTEDVNVLTDGENEENTAPGTLVIVVSSTACGTLLLVALIILIIVCVKKRWCRKPVVKQDVNDTYGTYARG